MTTPRKSLEHKQREHRDLLAKVERTTVRLARRTLRLSALESAIAVLEGRIAGTRGDDGEAAEGAHLARRAQLIFNPTSGRADEDNAQRLARIVTGLRAHGIEAAIGLKTSGKAARALAREAVRDRVPLVIVAAGDGTIGDVASQLIGSATSLGIVPIGTMNNVARSLGIPLGIDDACALIAMGTTRHIDAGRVHTDQGTNDGLFLDSAGVGLAAIGSLGGQAFEKRRWGVLANAFRRFFAARLGTMRIDLDGTAIEASTRIVTVSNAPLMGNNMLAAPGARMDDGYLDVSIYDGMGDPALVRHFLAASSHKPDDLRIYRARRVRITSEEVVLGHADMDITPARKVVEIEVVPAALSMIVGNGIGLTLPVASAPSAPTFATGPPSDTASSNGEKDPPGAARS